VVPAGRVFVVQSARVLRKVSDAYIFWHPRCRQTPFLVSEREGKEIAPLGGLGGMSQYRGSQLFLADPTL